MNDFRKEIIHDLAKEYTFRNFDFKNSSPEKLLTLYQETSNKLEDVFKKQDNGLFNNDYCL